MARRSWFSLPSRSDSGITTPTRSARVGERAKRCACPHQGSPPLVEVQGAPDTRVRGGEGGDGVCEQGDSDRVRSLEERRAALLGALEARIARQADQPPVLGHHEHLAVLGDVVARW